MTAPPPETNRQYVRHINAWSAKTSGFLVRTWAGRLRRLGLGAVRLLLFPWLLLTGLCLLGCLSLRHRKRPRLAPGATHESAKNYVRDFSAQYPLHFYPVLCKALETAFLKRELPQQIAATSKIVEVAIGEGPFSARLFPPTSNVTGLDLNPHSLAKAALYPHVRRAVVCDALDPPLRSASFDVLIANNILHHVTDKAGTLEHWSRVARIGIFNDCAPEWATGWPLPFILKKFGFRAASARTARRIETMSAQCLVPAAEVSRLVAQNYRVIVTEGFLSERTFFLCGLFSFLMLSLGAPTPPLLKAIMLGPLRPFCLWLTETLAHQLLRFDAEQSRSRDTFIFYVASSRNTSASSPDSPDLLCPDDRMALDARQICPHCDRNFQKRQGMLFMLPDELRSIEADFDPRVIAAVPAEHL